MKTSTEIASEYESKFRFYFVALVFTLLAASLQSAPLSEMQCINKVLEVSGWSLLLICGLSSLSFLEFSSIIYKNRGIAENNNNSEEIRALSAEVSHETSARSSVKYFIAKWSFVIGLVLIIASRAAHGFTIV